MLQCNGIAQKCGARAYALRAEAASTRASPQR
jgi:hypothetical protein